MEFADQVPVFLPSSYEKDVSGPNLEEFSSSLFNQLTIGGLFSKHKLTVNESVSFSAHHTNETCLKNVPKKQQKDAILLQKGILLLIGVRESKQFKGDIGDLLVLGSKDQSLIDEGYAILAKASNGSKDDALINTLKIVALWAKYFKPSQEITPYLLSHFAKLARGDNLSSEARRHAEFAYIRVSGATRSHKTLKVNKSTANEELNDIDNSHLCFGYSLEEIMWHQRAQHPKLYIPYVLHQMASRFINMGCLQTEGIFRLPGNKAHYEPCPEKANKGEDFLQGLDVKDIATLIKNWFQKIDGFIISEEFAHEHIYKTYDDPNEIVNIANLLPPLNKCILMYLVGFLRYLATAQSITQMGENNLSMTFAMSISYIPDNQEAVSTSTYVNYFIKVLIEKWDVNSIYPLPENML